MSCSRTHQVIGAWFPALSRPCNDLTAFVALLSLLTVSALIYEVIGRVKSKICTHLLLGLGRRSRAPARAFISTLDRLSRPLTIARGNEAKRSSVELRSLVEGFCCWGSVSSVWRGTEWQPGNK